MLSDKISPNITAAILSGGRNKRMNGRNKAFIRIGGAPFIQKTIKLLKEIFPETFIVTNSPAEYSAYKKDCRIISDEIKDIGPLGGIHAALSKTSKEAVFFVACDMPFLHNGFIRKEIAYFNKSDSDAVVPRITGLIEPLHAIYRKDLKDKISDFVKDSGNRSIRNFLATVKVSYWDVEDDILHRNMFKNLNTEEDLIEAGGKIHAGKIKDLV
ncbi:MAG: molybdenum cofactor guanylyltransferase [Candidatus Omnitrophota bacterium]